MRPVSTMLMRLNVETRVYHAAADAPLLELVRPDVRRLDYMHLLVRMYGFEAALEGACAYTPRLSLFLDLRIRARSGLIARDLITLGLAPVDVAALAHCPALATFHDAPEALGWMYVTERATLLHDGVRRNLVARLPSVDTACNYLAASSGRIAQRWNELGVAADRLAPHGDRMVAAARHAFLALREWFARPDAELRAS
jgi:heme oxygenase